MNKWLQGLLFGIVILANIILLYVLFLYFIQGNTPGTYADHPMKACVVNDSVIVTIEYCRYNPMPFTHYASFVNGIVFNLPPEEIVGTKTGCGIIKRSYVIPHEVPAGEYYINARSEFKVNALKTVSIGFVTERFNVTR